VEVALVSCDDLRYVKEDADRPHYVEAFGEQGIRPQFPAWSDPSIDWASFDLVVIRSTWDYPERLEEFLGWLDAVAHLPSLHNPAAVIRWNIDKRYLGELGNTGVPVVPTTYVTEADGWHGAFEGEVVVKPTVSAGSRLTGRFASDDHLAGELIEQIWAAGKTAMVQPAIASVATEGEIAVVALDGVVSHAFTKGPFLALGGGYVGGEYTEVVAPTPVTDELRTAVAGVEAALPFDDPLLYARYDFVRMDDGALALLEAELFEPSLFFAADPSAARRFVAAAMRRR
jgi:hypothetical protein